VPHQNITFSILISLQLLFNSIFHQAFARKKIQFIH